MYMCIYIYIYIYPSICVYTYIYIYIYIHDACNIFCDQVFIWIVFAASLAGYLRNPSKITSPQIYHTMLD